MYTFAHTVHIWVGVVCEKCLEWLVRADDTTYWRESCRICFLALMYMALAMRPITRTRPRAHATAPSRAEVWDGAFAGDGDTELSPTQKKNQTFQTFFCKRRKAISIHRYAVQTMFISRKSYHKTTTNDKQVLYKILKK